MCTLNNSKSEITNENKKLPAIKFFITKQAQVKLNTKSKIICEINLQKPTSAKKIKFVDVDGCLITIATDDSEAYNDLLQWAPDAFVNGITMKHSKKPSDKFRLVIKGFDLDIDLENFETQDQLKEQGITKMFRIKNYLKQDTTTTIAHINNENSYNKLLNNHIIINQLRFRTQPFIKILRCFNCNRLNHATYKCTEDATCARCSSTKHSTTKCRNKQLKCINCGGDHVSNSRKCPEIQKIQDQILTKMNSTNKTKTSNSISETSSSYTAAVTKELGNFKFSVLHDEVVAKLKDEWANELTEWARVVLTAAVSMTSKILIEALCTTQEPKQTNNQAALSKTIANCTKIIFDQTGLLIDKNEVLKEISKKISRNSSLTPNSDQPESNLSINKSPKPLNTQASDSTKSSPPSSSPSKDSNSPASKDNNPSASKDSNSSPSKEINSSASKDSNPSASKDSNSSPSKDNNSSPSEPPKHQKLVSQPTLSTNHSKVNTNPQSQAQKPKTTLLNSSQINQKTTEIQKTILYISPPKKTPSTQYQATQQRVANPIKPSNHQSSQKPIKPKPISNTILSFAKHD